MNRVVFAVFVICQLAGEIATGLSSHLSSAGGPWLWVISVVFLLPGDIAATWLIERFLWTSSWNLHQLQWFKMPCEILINAVVWMIVAAGLSRFGSRRERKNA
jgi:hypothetical protein